MTEGEVVERVAGAIVDGSRMTCREPAYHLNRHAWDSRGWLRLYREAKARATEIEAERRSAP